MSLVSDTDTRLLTFIYFLILKRKYLINLDTLMCESSETKLNFVSSRLCYANRQIECMLETENKVRYDHLWLLGVIRTQLFSGEFFS